MSTDNQPDEGVENEASELVAEETNQAETVEEQSVDTGEEGTSNEDESGTEEQSSDTKKDELPIGVQKRFAAMTKQKYEQQRQIEEMQAEMAQLRSRQTQEPPKTRDDFLDEQDWIDYRVKEQTTQLLKDQQEAQLLQMQQQQAQQQKATVWTDKVNSVKEEIADYEEVLTTSTVTVPDEAMGFIQESDIGPKLAYHLAKNPEEAESLYNLNEKALERKLLKLELRLENQPATKEVQPVTKAPTPVKGQKGSSGSVDMSSLSVDEWMKRRNKQVHG